MDRSCDDPIGAEPLTDEALMRIAARGSEDEPENEAAESEPSSSSRVINHHLDMSWEAWLAKYGSHDGADAADEGGLDKRDKAP